MFKFGSNQDHIFAKGSFPPLMLLRSSQIYVNYASKHANKFMPTSSEYVMEDLYEVLQDKIYWKTKNMNHRKILQSLGFVIHRFRLFIILRPLRPLLLLGQLTPVRPFMIILWKTFCKGHPDISHSLDKNPRTSLSRSKHIMSRDYRFKWSQYRNKFL